jgi:heavy metal translocating P-type ATPase
MTTAAVLPAPRGTSAAAALRRYPLVFIAATGLAGGLAARFGWHDVAVANRIFLSALVVAGLPLVWQTVRGLFHGRFAADVVASLAIVTALLLREYFAGVVIVLMQSGGEALEHYAMGRASSSLEALLERVPKIARLKRDGAIVEVAVQQVAVGDELVIRPGDLVPVDAVVTSGTSAVDQSALTGEPLPIRAVTGTELMSGSVNLDGVLEVRGTRVADQSQYQQVMRLVERARNDKPPIQRLADRFATWFTPLTLAMCAVAFWITRDWDAVLAVLVVATPCPLILATPIAVIAGISRAAAAGIVVKTGSAIEAVGRAQAVVFDKTGTLTLGHPTVTRVVTTNGRSADRVLALAGAVEQVSSHHLGQAIVAAARAKGGALPAPRHVLEAPGSGVGGDVEGHPVLVGSAGFLAERGISVPDVQARTTAAYVAIDGAIAGWIEFADNLRPQVPDLMRRLAALGISHTILLTGDRAANAAGVATQAGIRDVASDLLPRDKAHALEMLRRQYHTVVMVGDGINDAPALAAATVGIAMGAHGTAASADAADIVLLVDDVSRVADAIEISRRMRRIIFQSIGVGIGVSAALMIVAAFGYITPPAGAVMQEALDAAVILNALRAR